MGLLESVQSFSSRHFPEKKVETSVLSFRKEVMILKPSPSGSLTHAGFCTA